MAIFTRHAVRPAPRRTLASIGSLAMLGAAVAASACGGGNPKPAASTAPVEATKTMVDPTSITDPATGKKRWRKARQ